MVMYTRVLDRCLLVKRDIFIPDQCWNIAASLGLLHFAGRVIYGPDSATSFEERRL